MKKKDKGTAWHTTITIGMFEAIVHVIVCDSTDDLIATAKVLDKKFKCDTLFMPGRNKTLENNYLYSCAMQAEDSGGTIIVIFNFENPSKVYCETMVHEFHHAANFICSFRGVDDEETEAYLQEFLFSTMLSEIYRREAC